MLGLVPGAARVTSTAVCVQLLLQGDPQGPLLQGPTVTALIPFGGTVNLLLQSAPALELLPRLAPCCS